MATLLRRLVSRERLGQRFGRELGFLAEAGAARAALALFGALPPVAASNLGGALARVIGPLLPVSRVADRNLAAVFPALDARARRALVRQVWDNLGRTAAEFAHIGRLGRTASGPGWELVVDPAVMEAHAPGRPAIMVSAHIGNWELALPGAAALGFAVSGFYRAATNPRVDAIIQRVRRAAIGGEAPMFPKGAAGAQRAYAHLARGGLLGLLLDQKMNDGIEVPFLGLPAMTAHAPAMLALRFRCPVIPAHVERLGPARLRLVVEAPLPLPDTGDRREDVRALTSSINEVIGGWVRARPGEWLWLHRRWPKTRG